MASASRKSQRIANTTQRTRRSRAAVTDPGSANREPYLVFVSGSLMGRRCHLPEGSTVIGRSPACAVPVDDDAVSRHHVQIVRDGEDVVARDMDSTNGTFVNGRRIRQRTLAPGDKIRIGSGTIAEFILQDGDERRMQDDLYRMAVLDPLTHVHNRGFFMKMFLQEFGRATESARPLGLVLLDLDHFKAINDTHGHPVGDEALRAVASHMKESLTGDGLVARVGGEEFAILLPGTDELGALQVAERVRIRVESHPLSLEGPQVSLTASLGVVAMAPDRSFPDPDCMLVEADRALYESKRRGRNRSTCASQIEQEGP